MLSFGASPPSLLLGEGKEQKKNKTIKPQPPTNFLFSLERSKCASKVPARLAAADGWRGTALPECTTNFLSLLLAQVPPGMPSSHCSSFVYRKPDTNEIAAGTSGSKFPQAHAVLVPFPLPPHFSGSRHFLNCLSGSSPRILGQRGVGGGELLDAHLGAGPSAGGEGPPLRLQLTVIYSP